MTPPANEPSAFAWTSAPALGLAGAPPALSPAVVRPRPPSPAAPAHAADPPRVLPASPPAPLTSRRAGTRPHCHP